MTDEVCDKAEDGQIAVEDSILPIVFMGVIPLESITFLVLEECARYSAHCERIVVAVGCQLTAVQGLEIATLFVDSFQEWES